MDYKQRVVIISPTYNEKGNIVKLCQVLIDQIFANLKQQYDPHILIVDDSSPDGTGDEVKRLIKNYPNLHLITNPKKMGLGHAYIKGMNYALTKLNADIIFQFDADFQHDPSRIPVMLTKIEKGYDLVLGARYIKGGSIPKTWGLHRKFLSVVGNQLIRFVIAYFAIHDWTTGYRALKRKVIEAVLPELNSDNFMGYTFQIGFLHKAVRKKFKIAEIPLNFVDRTYGKSKLGAEYVKNNLIYIFKVRFSEVINSRLVKFGIVGLLGSIIQFIFLNLFRRLLPLFLSNIIAIEIAILSNFILNNYWTFADRKLFASRIITKFAQFNLASFGSIIIQTIIVILGEYTFGLKSFYFTDTGNAYVAIGIIIGMIWNYLVYNRFIWK